MLKFMQPGIETSARYRLGDRGRQLPAREAELSPEQLRALELDRTQPEGSQGPSRASAPEPAARRFQNWRCP